MTIEVRPATRFADVATMLGPKRSPDANVCWCLSHRVDARTNRELTGPGRGAYVEELCRREVAPGVLAHDGDEVCGWAGVAPRAELPITRSTKVAAYDDQPVWDVFCVRVRPGHRGRGISLDLVERAGFTKVADTASVTAGFPRVVMRRALTVARGAGWAACAAASRRTPVGRSPSR